MRTESDGAELIGFAHRDGWDYTLLRETGEEVWNRARFVYGNEELGFCFNMFSEVAAPFQHVFVELMNANGVIPVWDYENAWDRLESTHT